MPYPKKLSQNKQALSLLTRNGFLNACLDDDSVIEVMAYSMKYSCASKFHVQNSKPKVSLMLHQLGKEMTSFYLYSMSLKEEKSDVSQLIKLLKSEVRNKNYKQGMEWKKLQSTIWGGIMKATLF